MIHDMSRMRKSVKVKVAEKYGYDPERLAGCIEVINKINNP